MKADREGTRDAQTVPLCVDLDGSLVRTDTLVESLVAAMRDWHVIVHIPRWLLQGKAKLKAKLSERIKPSPELLPYNETVLQYLNEQKAHGRRLVLVTAANNSLAETINQHLGLFDEVIASDENQNLRGKEKARVLVERFGERQFGYLGNDGTDLHVWRVAHSGILVNTPDRVARQAADLTTIENRVLDRRPRARALIKILRPHQWVKNLLIFVPIVTSNSFGDFVAWLNAGLAFLAFCATASGIYVINDLFDLEADRKHPTKRNRSFASGSLSLETGFVLAPALLLLGLTFGIASATLLFVLSYAAIAIGYSVKLKKMPLADIFTLAMLYTIRLFAGGEATSYRVSFWLLAFSGFLFLSLAALKRVSELRQLSDAHGNRAARRGYRAEDSLVLQTMGIGSSFVSSLVLALYVQSDVAAHTYAYPQVLWGTVPVVLFWQCRLWLSTARGHMDDDPIIYAVKDWVSWLTGLALVTILLAANIAF